MMIVVFWLFVLVILYGYVLFPAFLLLCVKKKPAEKLNNTQEPVTILCSVFNEEKVIAQKINNFYEIDYPFLELYIGLDGCTDSTLEQIQKSVKDTCVKYFVFLRCGKANVINSLMEKAGTKYVVFTDANSMFAKDAISNLVKLLGEKTGVVCGKLLLVDKSNSGESFYWKFENLIKTRESLFGSVMGANGAIYLIRRDLFEKVPANTINDDFSISMKIYEKGYDIKFAADAIAVEEILKGEMDEFARHIRDGAGHYRAIAYLWRLLNPLHFKRFFFYVSHRLIRWLVPFCVVILYVLSAALYALPLYRYLFYLQTSFYLFAIIVYIFKIRAKPFYLPYYFVLLNTALLVGFVKNALGLQSATWSPAKR